MSIALVLAVVLVGAVVVVPNAGAPASGGKIEGRVYVVPGDFLIDLQDGHLAYLGVGLLLEPGEDLGVTKGGHGGASPEDGPDARAQRVRDVVVDVVGRQPLHRFRAARSQTRVREMIRRQLAAQAGVRARRVFFTDLALR